MIPLAPKELEWQSSLQIMQYTKLFMVELLK